MYCLVFIGSILAIASAIPSSVVIRPLSTTSVSVSWRQDFEPMLKGFTIHYHNGDGRSAEWYTKTVWDPRASEAVIDGLRPEGEYSFCVRSIMTGRVCPCSDLVHINMASGTVTRDQDEQYRLQQQQQQLLQQQQQQQQQQQGQVHVQHPVSQPQPQQGQVQVQQGAGGVFGQTDVQLLESGAIGGDYVQLRWRYDGPKPAKYMLSYRGYQRYEVDIGQWEEQEVDAGTPVEVDVEHYVAHGLRPDTMYTFEVVAIDQATGRPISRPQSIRVTTKAYIL